MSGSFAFFGLCSVVAVGVNGMIFLFAKKNDAGILYAYVGWPIRDCMDLCL